MTQENFTLHELVEKLKSEQLVKRDLVVPANCITMQDRRIQVLNSNSETVEDIPEEEFQVGNIMLDLNLLDNAHAQISDKLSIPKAYYDRMNTGHSGLLDINVNHWLNQTSKKYLLRTFVNENSPTGVLRAFLSDSFKVIDNLDVLMATLEAIRESGVNLQIQECKMSETKMYVRFIAPEIFLEAEDLLANYKVPGSKVRNEDFKIFSGLVISNSEIGNGSYTISPYGIVSACSNGMVWRGDAMRKIHLGSKLEESNGVQWSEETRNKNLELILSQTKDAVKLFVSPDYLGAKIDKLREAADIPLNHPFEAVKNVCKELSYSQEKQESIMNYFVQGGDTSAFGITQAMTYYAGKDADADEKFDMQDESIRILDQVKRFDKPDREQKND